VTQRTKKREQTATKRVQVTIEVSEHFLRMLKSTVELSGWGNLTEPYRPHTAAATLAVVVLNEARGAPPEQVHAQIPHEWRPDIEAISDQRKVLEVK